MAIKQLTSIESSRADLHTLMVRVLDVYQDMLITAATHDPLNLIDKTPTDVVQLRKAIKCLQDAESCLSSVDEGRFRDIYREGEP